jgi:hypothetical protein
MVAIIFSPTVYLCLFVKTAEDLLTENEIELEKVEKIHENTETELNQVLIIPRTKIF